MRPARPLSPVSPAFEIAPGDTWAPYADLRRDVLAFLAAQRPPTTELFERLCSLEQVLSDVAATLSTPAETGRWRDAIASLSQACVAAAGAVWFRRTPAVGWFAEVSESLARLPSPGELHETWRSRAVDTPRLEIFEYLEMWPIWPECLSSEPIDYRAYADRVVAHLRSMRRVPQAVLGLRTSGSFLGPIWAAALEAHGHPAVFATIRPLHSTLRMRNRTLPTWSDPHVDTARFRGLRAVVVDDLISTGTTLKATLEAVEDVGTALEETAVSLYRQPPAAQTAKKLGVARDRLLPVRRASRRWPQTDHREPPPGRVREYFQTVLGAEADPWEVTRVEQLAYGHAFRYLLKITGSTPAAAAAHVHGSGRYRRYLLGARRGGAEHRLVAKPVGFGYFASDEARRLSGLPHYAPVLGIVGGYLFYHWVDGIPLPFQQRTGVGELSEQDLETIAETAASGAGRAPGVIFLPREGIGSRIRATIGELRAFGAEKTPGPEKVLRAIDETWIPVVSAPANNGHWHYVRNRGGQLLKLHREVANVARRSDPVEDIGAAGVELGLSPDEIMRSADAYAWLSGDRPSRGRLAFGILSHISRALREFAYYRERVTARMECPAVRVDSAFSRREEGIRGSIGLAGALLD